MSKRSLLLPVFAPALFLFACTEQVVEQAVQPSGELFHFYAEGLDSRASYRCVSGPSYPDTKSRAEAAHAVFMSTLQDVLGREVGTGPVATSAQMNEVGQSIAPQLGKAYRCVMVAQ
mgnify:CR=1 FL=1